MEDKNRNYERMHTPRQSQTAPRYVSDRPVPRGVEPEPQPRHVVRHLPDYQQRSIPDVSSLLQPKKRRRLKLKFTKRLLRAAIVIGVLLIVGIFGLIKATDNTVPPTVERDSVADQASDVLGIKTGEAPITMTVTDKNALTDPALKQAENGDRVLFYYQAKKVALIRPSTGAILYYGDFTPPPAKVFVRSGSKIADVKKVVEMIKKDGTLSFVSQDSSPLPAYFDSIVIDLSERYPEEAKRLASNVKGTVTALPDGESKPEADILIIVGAR